MTKYFINGKLVGMTKSAQPHGSLREMLTDAKLNGAKVELVRE